MIKVLGVFGTRPEAIKFAPVIGELSRRSEQFDCKVCVTAQHREMLDDVLRLFSITPDHDLNVMVGSQSPSDVTAAVHLKLDVILREEQPQWVLVQGDTTSTMAAAMTAYFNHSKVGHIEAGLRTADRWQPFPEEINRRVTDLVSDLHFAPTEQARANLIREGIPDKEVRVTGNTVIDALLEITSREFDPRGTPLETIDLNGAPLILVTSHRRESFGVPLENICRALREIALKFPEVQIVYPVHMNPKVRDPVSELLEDIKNVSLLPPLDYLSLAQLMKHAHLILTDSGGIQEEAPSLGVPVLVLRNVTERPEVIEAGVGRLVGTDAGAIVKATTRLLEDPSEHAAMARPINLYGDGQARIRIADAILERS